LKNDTVVFHSLSRVHFIIAKTTKSAESMRTSRLYIQKAIHANPSDKSLLFNLALIEQQTAQVLNDQPSESRSVEDLKAVMKDIELSEKYSSS
jgi:RNA polymerase-associated protein CTR9